MSLPKWQHLVGHCLAAKQKTSNTCRCV